jgi:hypothetical protein
MSMERWSFEEVQVTRPPKMISRLRLRSLAAPFSRFYPFHNLVNPSDTVHVT